MKIFSQVKILSLSAKVCDRCGYRAEENNQEFQEFLSVDRLAGFGSIFGDGESLRLDLCQRCVKDVLGQWIQIGNASQSLVSNGIGRKVRNISDALAMQEVIDIDIDFPSK
ncbi:hypothetical protein ACI51Z_10735 [Pectobacterium carotovorum]|uniref:hypothetical protein n=1 Tax=Pectobacteriaceae TaxID=1903410 RepID=UPI0003D793DF|nr:MULTISPECIES: hypothetical protein [Pectobacteriaceae]MCI4117175.1 hypothetical protein [Dickeya dianthicola]MCI4121304.1 hypothetical protein [Dickeya dianthicola]MCI4125142.1 hypothetical protein [Dickeya dianthicola]MCI4192547.1 hypothetical protein [Dickeya dianthicola]MCI4201197.1 hypothetical protein [Dickeya dianthicola]